MFVIIHAKSFVLQKLSLLRQVSPFYCWLLVFYSAWAMIVLRGDYWSRVLEQWPIALAMALGSYFAGSTPMGGGAVGFPVLVLLLDRPASMGRIFGLAIQSIGMVSASIFILSKGYLLDRRLLRPALLGALVATPVGVIAVAPFMHDLTIKLLFAMIWASFGLVHLRRMREITSLEGASELRLLVDREIGFAIGILGGIASSVTGVGIDMLLYMFLVFLYRSDLKIAVPTSVVLMAFTSVVGIVACLAMSLTNFSLYRIPDDLLYSWLAAAPVVAIGAPLGAVIVKLIPRSFSLGIVSILCLAQFGWTMVQEQVGILGIAGCLSGIILLNLAMDWLLMRNQSPVPQA